MKVARLFKLSDGFRCSEKSLISVCPKLFSLLTKNENVSINKFDMNDKIRDSRAIFTESNNN